MTFIEIRLDEQGVGDAAEQAGFALGENINDLVTPPPESNAILLDYASVQQWDTDQSGNKVLEFSDNGVTI